MNIIRMIFSVKLLSGTILDVTLNDNFYDLSFFDIKINVFEVLPVEISNNITPRHINLFSYGYDKDIYTDIRERNMIGCYINKFIVEIDFDDYNEYFLEYNDYDKGPYERIVFKVVTNVVILKFIIYDNVIKTEFLRSEDYGVTSRTGRNLEYVTIDSYDSNYKLYKSIEELFISRDSITISNEDIFSICAIAQKEYENFRKGLVESRNEEELWEELKNKEINK